MNKNKNEKKDLVINMQYCWYGSSDVWSFWQPVKYLKLSTSW